jgi:hypothetical protein
LQDSVITSQTISIIPGLCDIMLPEYDFRWDQR